MTMTPDEVVKELEIHYQTNCMVGSIGVAVKSAITQIQDYQKLRERELDLEKEIVIYTVNGCEGKAIVINDYRVAGSKPWGGGNVDKKWNCRLKDIVEAIPELKQIVTYLQQPTEHIER